MGGVCLQVRVYNLDLLFSCEIYVDKLDKFWIDRALMLYLTESKKPVGDYWLFKAKGATLYFSFVYLPFCFL